MGSPIQEHPHSETTLVPAIALYETPANRSQRWLHPQLQAVSCSQLCVGACLVEESLKLQKGGSNKKPQLKLVYSLLIQSANMFWSPGGTEGWPFSITHLHSLTGLQLLTQWSLIHPS